jgi:hypothetical protein
LRNFQECILSISLNPWDTRKLFFKCLFFFHIFQLLERQKHRISIRISSVDDEKKKKKIKYFGMEEGKAMTSRERAFSRMLVEQLRHESKAKLVKLKISNQGKLDALRQFEGAEVDLVQRSTLFVNFAKQ